MKRLAGISTLALLVASTSGCSWLWGDDGYFRDRQREYQTAAQKPPMKVPAGTQARSLEPMLPIPGNVPSLSQPGEFEVPRPPHIQARIEQQGDSVSLLQAQRSSDRAPAMTLSRSAAGEPMLVIDSDFNRAWSVIGRALQAADVRVEDLNRSLGLYYVNLAESAEKPDEEKGFFSGLFGGEPDQKDIDARAERYLVRVSEAGEQVEVTVGQSKSGAVPDELARNLLGRIQRALN